MLLTDNGLPYLFPFLLRRMQAFVQSIPSAAVPPRLFDELWRHVINEARDGYPRSQQPCLVFVVLHCVQTISPIDVTS